MLQIIKYFNNIVNKTGFKRSKPTLVYYYKVLYKDLHFHRDLKSFFLAFKCVLTSLPPKYYYKLLYKHFLTF